MGDSQGDDKERREKWVAFVQSLNPEIDPVAVRLMDEMRSVFLGLHRIGEHSLVSAGLSYAQYRILMSLWVAENVDGRQELNPSEISQKQGTSRNTISTLIRNLEDVGLVERSLNQRDRRKFNIRLTDAGRTLVHEHVNRHMRVIGSCFSQLTATEQETFSQLLGKVGASFSAQTPEDDRVKG